MEKINLNSLNLTNNKTTSTFDFNGQNIEVLNYLPIEDKYDLVMITLQKSEEDGYYNPMKLDMFFHLHLVYMYTNIAVDGDMEETEIYDLLETSGLLAKVVDVMEDSEYNELYHYLETTKDEVMTFKNTTAAVISKVINDLPKNAALAAEIVQNFNPEQYEAVANFATAANGGRPINLGALGNIGAVLESAKQPALTVVE